MLVPYYYLFTLTAWWPVARPATTLRTAGTARFIAAGAFWRLRARRKARARAGWRAACTATAGRRGRFGPLLGFRTPPGSGRSSIGSFSGPWALVGGRAGGSRL